MFRSRWQLIGGLAALGLGLVGPRPAPAQILAPNLIYTSIEPCRVFDTRSSGSGKLVHGVTQAFNVVGGNVSSTTFTGQGGHNMGCSIPGFDSGGHPQAQAVVFNFVAVGSAGGGDIVAWPTDHAQPMASIINYANSAALGFLNLANGIVVPVRQDSQGGDITLKAQVSDTDVLADVVGYFSSVTAVQSTGVDNLTVGKGAGNQSIATGNANAAFGTMSLPANTSGSSNSAFGDSALIANTSGSNNIGIGDAAGAHIVAGGGNIHIGGDSTADEANTIRIGNPATQTSAFLAGIFVQPVAGSGMTVLVDNSGKLGTFVSSLRFKEDVQDMGEQTAGLMQLRPVTFHYKPEYDGGSRLLQYGLIAEEVAQVYPDLVHYDQDGKPLTVRYHLINAMLLNEVQRQEREIAGLRAEIAGVAELRAEIAAQKRLAADQEARLERLEAALGRQ